MCTKVSKLRGDISVALIGLDGVGESLLVSVTKKYNLKYLARFIPNIVTFKSIPPYTPLAWTSIMTGVNPGKHGIFGFSNIKRGPNGELLRFHINSARDVMFPRLFEILSMRGVRSIIINIPFTYPFRYVYGFRDNIIVTDWTVPRQHIWPRNLESKYRKILKMAPPHDWSEATSPIAYVENIEKFLRSRLMLYYDLVDEEEWGLFVIIFSETDWIQHILPPTIFLDVTSEAGIVARDIWREIDEFVGYLLRHTNFSFIVSDHSFSRKSLTLYVYNLLERIGIIHTTKLLKMYYHLRFRAKNPIIKKTLKLIRHTAGLLGLRSPFKKNQSTPITTRVILTEPETLGIYISRDRNYEATKQQIIALNRYQRCIRFLDARDIYWGPHTRRGPDIVYIVKSFIDIKTWGLSVLSKGTSYNHDYPAIVSFYARNNGRTKVIADILSHGLIMYDLAPIILWLFGAFAPYRFDSQMSVKKILTEKIEDKIIHENRKMYKQILRRFMIRKLYYFYQ